MQLSSIDWLIIILYFLVVLAVGVLAAKTAGKNSQQFFLGGRQMPWWLLGLSMVATTFSTDTPNLVTDIVRQHGVAGNWVWWAFLITGMVTVFFFAKLWRRSAVMTDMEFLELRYSGKSAAFLRAFRSIYLGVFFNVMIMAFVSLAAIKIGGVILDLSPLQSIFWAGSAAVVFSSVGGFRGVVFTDCILFVVSMTGAIVAAYFAINHADIGSLSALLEHPNVVDKLSFFPPLDAAESASQTDQILNLWITLLIVPLVVQWWSVWYPGSEPGGGGYVAQRMLAAKDERHALGAILFFNFAHYGLRPWPWILVALASLVVFPTLEDISAAFPNLDPSTLGHDLAYPAMLTFLPSGWMGLVLASLIAAYMSTISTHLNWGSSYVTHDFYRRFVRPTASEKQLVFVGRISTVGMMVLAGWLALQLRSALDTFQLFLQVGAGTGLIFMVRWFWWRINAFSELSAMIASFVVAVLFKSIDLQWAWWLELVVGIAITTAIWVSVTLMTPASDMKTLKAFYVKVRPGGPGWQPVRSQIPEALPESESLAPLFVSALTGIIAVYAFLFGVGQVIYGQYVIGALLLILAVALGQVVLKGQAASRMAGS